MLSRRRAIIADVVGLGAILLVLLDYLRPELLLLPTIAAGGDTPCHYPTADWFHNHLLPRLRLHGWYPGAYLGHPLLLYYFPLPFLVMSSLVPVAGLPVAFKLGTVLGVFLLPLLTYASFRLMGFRFPAPLLGAAASLLFLFLEENPIWGGTIASTLTGEFAYTYGLGLAVLFLGVAYRAYSRGWSPWIPAAVLAVTALAHGYAVLWAGLSASYFLFHARRPARTLGWLALVGSLAFALAGFWLLPLLAGWGWTTPYDDPWITVSPRNLLPPLLWPLFLAAFAGLGATLALRRRLGGPDHRILFLLHSALAAAALAAAGPVLGIIDVRFVPFAQLALCLAGAASVGLVAGRLAAPDLAALGLVGLAVIHGDANSRVLRAWIEWNYTGLEAKENWPAFRRMTASLAGGVGDPRVAVEYGAEHEKAGSIRMYETLPFFSGRSTLEGVYNQASVMTHPVYYLASELGATSPNPFQKREYSRFDPEGALAHLRLFNVSEVVTVSAQLAASLQSRPGVERIARLPPYSVFRLPEDGLGYVEPLAFAPVRSPRRDWRDKSYRWFTRKPFGGPHLVFTDDPAFTVVEGDEWLAPPARPLPGGVEAHATMGEESITITTSRAGHPLLVKVSYHPRWTANGADGPYLASPGLMIVVPKSPIVTLTYARTAADHLGLALTLLAVIAAVVHQAVRRFRRRDAPAPVVLPEDSCAVAPAPRRWGAAVPAGVILILFASRGLSLHETPPDPLPLYEAASRAYAEDRFADAAEYARHALTRATASSLRPELLCLRGESLLRSGQPRLAAEAFEGVVQEGSGPYLPQALFGAARAYAAAGNPGEADLARERLLRDHADTPWARRAAAEPPI
jgi:hypothetical protein